MLGYTQTKKCVFYQLQIEFFRYKIFNEGLLINPKNIKVITNQSTPWTIDDIQYFLEFLNFYQIFIKKIIK